MASLDHHRDRARAESWYSVTGRSDRVFPYYYYYYYYSCTK